MRAVKTVQQSYTPTPELLWLLDEFRGMLNDCIRIGLRENVTSLKSLSLEAYKQLAAYDLMSYYKLCAISKAVGILRNYRKAKRKSMHLKEPYAWRPQLVTCYGLKIADGNLLLPFKPHQPLRIPLNRHTLQVLSELGLSVRSVTLTARTVGLTFSKETVMTKPTGLMGIDRNLDNITVADTAGLVQQYNLTKATEIKSLYREVKSHFVRNDARTRRNLFQKYGLKQRNRVKQLLHQASKQIVDDAKRRQHGIVMEKLTGIRKLYQKGNWQGRFYRGRMNSWSFAELQRQVEYKARWEGIPVIYVNPSGTSVKCSMCGLRMARVPEENRQLKCHSCGFIVDRDVNAAKNILARALRFGADAPASEAMVEEPAQPQAVIPQSMQAS